MSRLDYVTVGIVAICLAALGFLVYKTVGLMNGDTKDPAEEAYVDPYPVDTTLYDTTTTGALTDEDLEDSELSTSSFEEEVPSNTTSKGSSSSTTKAPEKKETTPPKTTTKPSRASDDEEVSSSSAGAYSVQAGSFKERINAENQVSRLKKLGYSSAEVATSNRGAFAVAVVDRFSNYDDAAALVKELKSKHDIDGLVKKRQ